MKQKLAMLKDAVPAKHSQLDEAIGLVPQLEDNPAAQDRFAQLVLSTLDGSQIDATEGLQRIQEQNGSTLFAKLLPPIILPTAKQDDDGDDGGSVTSLDDVATTGGDGDAESIGSVFGSILGRRG